MPNIFDLPEGRHTLIKRTEAAFEGKATTGIAEGFRLRRWDNKQQCSVYWGSSNLPSHPIELAVSPLLAIGNLPYRDVVGWVEKQIATCGSRGAKHKGSESWPTIGFDSLDAYFRFLEQVNQLRTGRIEPRAIQASAPSDQTDDQHPGQQPIPIEATAFTLLDSFRRKIGNEKGSTVAFRRQAQRIGQTLLRRALVAHWSGACALTGFAVVKLLRTSHIKRWAESTDVERLDIHNALLLAPQADAAFDAGFITFADDGRLLAAENLTDQHLEALALSRAMSLRVPPSPSQREYLQWHRLHLYRNL